MSFSRSSGAHGSVLVIGQYTPSATLQPYSLGFKHNTSSFSHTVAWYTVRRMCWYAALSVGGSFEGSTMPLAAKSMYFLYLNMFIYKVTTNALPQGSKCVLFLSSIDLSEHTCTQVLQYLLFNIMTHQCFGIFEKLVAACKI